MSHFNVVFLFYSFLVITVCRDWFTIFDIIHKKLKSWVVLDVTEKCKCKWVLLSLIISERDDMSCNLFLYFKLTGKWEGRTAGGCANNKETWPNNPRFKLVIDTLSQLQVIIFLLLFIIKSRLTAHRWLLKIIIIHPT